MPNRLAVMSCRFSGSLLLGCALLLLTNTCLSGAQPPARDAGDSPDIAEANPKAAAVKEAKLLTNTRQLTFEGRRSGEGYFSRDGAQMVFQSEREPGNPFFQIYVLDMETGDVERVSPGVGKTTCAWIHPSGKRVLFASTQDDPDAAKKQREEMDRRAAGTQRRYAWDYDEHFEVYDFDRDTGKYKNLTGARGYDAEGSWSPDGKLIAFTSNRRAYVKGMTAEEKKNFAVDPAYMNDIYLMNADGSNLRRLTSAPGYDGGPFFSPNGKRICWRRFTPNGAIAEVWTMKIDGSDQRQLTRLGAMSWAPFYHPSGEYLIFTTNRHGFSNFELYLVDAAGKSTPVRVSYTKGFDGLPVFTPDGQQMVWTTNRTTAKRSQIFVANWNHEHARKLLGLDGLTGGDAVADAQTNEAQAIATLAGKQATAGFSPQDIMRHVDYLCRPELGGRQTGTAGEKLATAYVAAYLDNLGLKPAGDRGSWFQSFAFTSGVDLGQTNSLSDGKKRFEINKDWRPLSFSGNGNFAAAPLVFAGYGMQARGDKTREEYDSFVHLDVKDKWVVVLRYMPEQISAPRRQQLSRASQLRFKATVARDLGARGLIIVTGPNAKAKNRLVPLRLDGILAGSSLPVISVTDQVAEAWFAASGKSLKSLQERLDTGDLLAGFPLKGVTLSATVDVRRIKGKGRNVLGRLQIGPKPSAQVVIVGAHIDHLGKGASSSSLARDDEASQIHVGADDNASGVASMLEVAEYLADQRKQGKLKLRRDVLFAAWSGEELGLLGSDFFVKNYPQSPGHLHAQGHGHNVGQAPQHAPNKNSKRGLPKHGPAKEGPPKEGPAKHGPAKTVATPPKTVVSPSSHANPHTHHASQSIYPAVAACINMDMVGRLDKNLILQGVGSSSIWRGEIERRNAPVGLPITLQEDSYLPTDAKSFYMRGVPILSAFTGSHSEYHTPRDTPEKLNYQGAASIARLMGLLTRSVAMRSAPPDFVAQEASSQTTVGRLRAYLGTIPDYAEEVKGVLLSGARKGGPADKAGVKTGDIIVELAGKKIENIYDYTHAIEALKIGQKVKMVVLRNGKRVPLEVVPGSRE